MASATYTAAELAEQLSVSEWSIYESVRRGDCPVPPIRVGRRIVFAKVAVDRLLLLEPAGPEPAA